MKSHKTKWALAGLISLAAYIPVYTAVSTLAIKDFSVRTRLTLDHLLYVLDQGDDMAVIDWGKATEKEDGILAFRLTVGSKISAEGGNLKRLLSPGDHMLISQIRRRGDKADIKLEIAYQNKKPGVLLAGSLSALLCLLAAFITGSHFFRGPEAEPARAREDLLPKPVASKLDLPAVLPPNGQAEAVVFIDHGLLIQQATEKAAQLFNMKAPSLLHTHLLDLEPSSELLEALSGRREIELRKAFLPHPGISAFIKPDSNGTFLHLTVQSTRDEV